MDNINKINAALALGNYSGYFYSVFAEGEFSLGGEEHLFGALQNPQKAGDDSLGQKIKQYQHTLLKIKKGGKLYENDLDFLCSVYGSSVEKKGNLRNNNVELKPFEITLFTKVTDLRHQTPTKDLIQVYDATDIKAGLNLGFDRGELSIRYKLTPKN